MNTYRTLLKNELRLSLRGMDMIIFAICFPVVVMALLGIIYGAKPAFEGAAYTFVAQSFGAVSSIAICAGGLMGLPLVISDYRQKKILKRFQVTPINPVMILAVHVTIYILYSLVSLALVYATAALFGYEMNGNRLGFLGAFSLVMLSTFSIGVMVGGIAKDSKSAGIIASVLYFPTLILSGATLPYEVLPPILQKIVSVLPLTQGIKLLKATSLGQPVDSVWLPIILMAALMVVCVGVALKCFKWE